ncbi:EF-hand domain-containing protein [Rhodophyticola porphyridii]|uniref:EF-hand domain-containing protein n=1 Tax=Rhodophyticola porphyridii TaxID=1852017 RepID=A0A3L9Y2S0_9RHOB|nr:hypothetical protein [Rhodophyticola porphyridii]RMA43099.1 hypothetical protein D9R08_05565 [Rhodophyticola porphyridii]
MKTVVSTVALIAALTAAPAFAETMVSDTDGDGLYSLEEVQAAMEDVTEEMFAAADTDGDGFLSEDELTAAEEAGTFDA